MMLNTVLNAMTDARAQKVELTTPRHGIASIERATIDGLDGYEATVYDGFAGIRVRSVTNGYRGGDAGHGSRTIVEFGDADSGASIEFKRVVREHRNGGHTEGVRFILAGDIELSGLINALRFAADALEVQARRCA